MGINMLVAFAKGSCKVEERFTRKMGGLTRETGETISWKVRVQCSEIRTFSTKEILRMGNVMDRALTRWWGWRSTLVHERTIKNTGKVYWPLFVMRNMRVLLWMIKNKAISLLHSRMERNRGYFLRMGSWSMFMRSLRRIRIEVSQIKINI